MPHFNQEYLLMKCTIHLKKKNHLEYHELSSISLTTRRQINVLVSLLNVGNETNLLTTLITLVLQSGSWLT